MSTAEHYVNCKEKENKTINTKEQNNEEKLKDTTPLPPLTFLLSPLKSTKLEKLK